MIFKSLFCQHTSIQCLTTHHSQVLYTFITTYISHTQNQLPNQMSNRVYFSLLMQLTATRPYALHQSTITL